MFTNNRKVDGSKLKKTIDDLQEIIDDLTLGVKYLIFDLEATRRENQELKKMLSDRDS